MSWLVQLWIGVMVLLCIIDRFLSIMSGDSPNAVINDNLFDFKEGRASPTPTTSKEQGIAAVTASVQVEPPKEKKEKEGDKEEDKPDFSSPILNPGADESSHIYETGKTQDFKESKHEGGDDKDKKDEEKLLNGIPSRDESPSRKDYDTEESDEDSCIVNCLYYTMECCKCTIL